MRHTRGKHRDRRREGAYPQDELSSDGQAIRLYGHSPSRRLKEEAMLKSGRAGYRGNRQDVVPITWQMVRSMAGRNRGNLVEKMA